MTALNTTRPFTTGRSQAIRIPKEYRFADGKNSLSIASETVS